MRYATRETHPCLMVSLRAHLSFLLDLLPGSALPRAARVCRIFADRKNPAQTPRNILGVLRPLVLTLGLLTLFGCAGGFEGSTRVAPSITLQPTSQTVALGLPSTFTVTATGTGPFSYQWYKSGIAIMGATSSSYTTPPTVGSDNGSVFTVTVSNASGMVTSASVSLTVTGAALRSIAVTPLVASIARGTAQQFTATGTYSDSTTQNITTSVTWASATTSVATIGASTGLATGVAAGTSQITSTQGSIVSPAATLTVINSAPVATSLVCSTTTPAYNSSVGLVPTFSGGTAVIGSSGSGSTDITASAVSGNSYPTPALISAKTYTLTVTGGGNVATTACTATPTSVTISGVSPAGQTIAPGQQTFTASVTGGATGTVTWTASGGSFSGSVWTSPTTAGSYTITATSVDEPSVSRSTTVIVSLPVITAQPISQNLCTGGTIAVSVTANYASTFHWNLGGSAISGATSSSYTISSAASANAGSYTVTVTNAAGSVTSGVAQVVVGSTITSNPSSLSIYATQTATFSVSVTGQSPFTYQWYEIPFGSSTATAIAGAMSSSYTTPAVDASYNGAKYYAAATDSCGGGAFDSTQATLTVTAGNVSPTITTEPTGATVAAGGTTTFSATASGTPTLTYQWYQIPAGITAGTAIFGATSASYTVPSSETTTSHDQDKYYVIVSNTQGQAVSQDATLAVGNGILIQLTNQPTTVYVNPGAPATFQVVATSTLPLTYQWYEAAPGSSIFTAISGATSATYTQGTTTSAETGSVFHVVVSNGSTSSVTSGSAALFVGSLSGVSNFCSASGWLLVGNATGPTGPTGSGSNCSFQLTAGALSEHGEIVWPTLISTGNIQLSYTITVSNTSNPPADGFAMVLGDPSLGATTSSTGAVGSGLGAEGIPGFVLGFDTYFNSGIDPIAVPYLGVGRGETALWEKPWLNVNGSIPALATFGSTDTHNYVVTIVQGTMTVTMDGQQVFSGNVTVPSVAYLYFTASTGGSYEQAVISSLTAAVSAPSN